MMYRNLRQISKSIRCHPSCPTIGLDRDLDAGGKPEKKNLQSQIKKPKSLFIQQNLKQLTSPHEIESLYEWGNLICPFQFAMSVCLGINQIKPHLLQKTELPRY
ncbi:hypothetical protein AN935_10530 [Bacillus inaquosorum]|nr:hypothetical protein AN935_10530 [Bacillus inaquosorum]